MNCHAAAADADQPSEFKLLIEELRADGLLAENNTRRLAATRALTRQESPDRPRGAAINQTMAAERANASPSHQAGRIAANIAKLAEPLRLKRAALFCRRCSMDCDDVAFPDANEIAPHALAFARMMFAHAEFERGIRSLVDALKPEEPGFGERRENQWTASESGTARFIILIMRHCGCRLPQIEQIRNLLDEAVHLCRERNFLAHGTWWCFNLRTKTVEIRGGLRWERLELPPGNREYTVPDIEGLADKFKDIEAELYKIRRSLEPKMTDAEIRAASSFLRAP